MGGAFAAVSLKTIIRYHLPIASLGLAEQLGVFMLKYALSALVCMFVSSWSLASNNEDYSPQFKAYTNFNFGAPKAQVSGFHYGLRIDQDSREQLVFGVHKPSILQVDFSKESGYESTKLYGMPLAAPKYQTDLIGADSTLGKTLWFGSIFILGGVVYGIHELTHNKHDDPPPTGMVWIPAN